MHRAQQTFLEAFPIFVTCAVVFHLSGACGSLSCWGSILYLVGRMLFLPLYSCRHERSRQCSGAASVPLQACQQRRKFRDRFDVAGGRTQILLRNEFVSHHDTINSRGNSCAKPAFGVLDDYCFVRLRAEPWQCGQVRVCRGFRARAIAFRQHEAHVVHDGSALVYQFKVRAFRCRCRAESAGRGGP